MLRGYIDRTTSCGYVEGWAFDSNTPLQPLTVAILDRSGREIAWGLAHRYRGDLATAGCAGGWCAFRLRSSVPIATLRRQPLKLIERASRHEIQLRFPVPYAKDFDPDLSALSVIVASDPSVTVSIVQLAECRDVFDRYAARNGIEAFVRAAYIYVLGRPADVGGLGSYSRAIRTNALTPLQLLTTLAQSPEFGSRSRTLPAPNTPAFPFD